MARIKKENRHNRAKIASKITHLSLIGNGRYFWPNTALKTTAAHSSESAQFSDKEGSSINFMKALRGLSGSLA